MKERRGEKEGNGVRELWKVSEARGEKGSVEGETGRVRRWN